MTAVIAVSATGLLTAAIGLAVAFLAVVVIVAVAGPANPAPSRRRNDGRVVTCGDCRRIGRACRYHAGYRAGYHAATGERR